MSLFKILAQYLFNLVSIQNFIVCSIKLGVWIYLCNDCKMAMIPNQYLYIIINRSLAMYYLNNQIISFKNYNLIGRLSNAPSFDDHGLWS